MFSGKSILAIILARGNSKGVPGKNIKPIAGKPLIAWTIQASLRSKYTDRLIVSTDSDEIRDVSIKWGAEVPFKRPSELATDEATSESVLLHALNWIQNNEDNRYDYFILLQPTCPLRNEMHIDESIKKIIEDPEANSLVSVKEASANPYWMKVINSGGYLSDFMKRKKRISRRQNLPKIFQPNGAIYISKMKHYLETGSFYAGNTSYYLMDAASSVDIDDFLDFEIAQYLIEKRDSSSEQFNSG